MSQDSLNQGEQNVDEGQSGSVQPQGSGQMQAHWLPPAPDAQPVVPPAPYGQQPIDPYSRGAMAQTPPSHGPYGQEGYGQTRFAPAPQVQAPYTEQQSQYPTQQRPLLNQYNEDNYLTYDQRASRIVGGIFGTLFVIAAIWGLVWLYKAEHPAPVLAPTAYTKFTVGDGGFSMDQPAGWASDSGGMNGVESNATFTSGYARIHADSDLGGSLNADMLTANNNQEEQIAEDLGKTAHTIPPIITIHKEGEQDMLAHYANYQEQPMVAFQCGLGQGYYSEFTGNAGGFAGNVHGYRATVLDNDRRVTVVEYCKVSDWQALQAPFVHELESLSTGAAAPGQQ